MQCWQDLSQFQQFLLAMLAQAGPVPLQGVTDGSDAKPGFIGEYMTIQAQMAFAANPAVTTTILSVGVIPPGDWDLTCSFWASTYTGPMYFVTSPTPAGLSNQMAGRAFETAAAATSEIAMVIGQAARGSFTVPTLIPFSCTVDQSTSTGLIAGTANMRVEARRIR
jgi:hypothetical protein